MFATSQLHLCFVNNTRNDDHGFIIAHCMSYLTFQISIWSIGLLKESCLFCKIFINVCRYEWHGPITLCVVLPEFAPILLHYLYSPETLSYEEKCLSDKQCHRPPSLSSCQWRVGMWLHRHPQTWYIDAPINCISTGIWLFFPCVWVCSSTASVRLFIYKRISKKGRQYYLSYTKSVWTKKLNKHLLQWNTQWF